MEWQRSNCLFLVFLLVKNTSRIHVKKDIKMHFNVPTLLSKTAFISLAIFLSSTVFAHSEGDLVVRAGLGDVMPNESSNDPNGVGELELNDETNIAGTISYMMSDNFGLEVLLGLPFKHEVSTSSLGKIADASHLPLSVAAQYYFGDASSSIRPYVGAGFNYTTFLDEEGTGALEGKEVSIDNSFGLAFQAGTDFTISDKLFVNVSLWYLDIKTTAHAQGLQDVDLTIDPLALFVGVGYSF